MLAMSALPNQRGTESGNVPIVIDDDEEVSLSTVGNRLRALNGQLIRPSGRTDVATIQLNPAALAAVASAASNSKTQTISSQGMSMFAVQSNGLPIRTERTVLNRPGSVGPLIARVGSLKEPEIQVSSIPSVQLARSVQNSNPLQTLTAIPAGQITCIPGQGQQVNSATTGLPANTIFVLPSPLLQSAAGSVSSVIPQATTVTAVFNGSALSTSSIQPPRTVTSLPAQCSFVQSTQAIQAPAVMAQPILQQQQAQQVQANVQSNLTTTNPPTYLNASTAIAPGQIHRLLLTPTDGSNAKTADLAIVYLGQNCWRPIVLPSGFDAMSTSGPLLGRKSSTSTG